MARTGICSQTRQRGVIGNLSYSLRGLWSRRVLDNQKPRVPRCSSAPVAFSFSCDPNSIVLRNQWKPVLFGPDSNTFVQASAPGILVGRAKKGNLVPSNPSGFRNPSLTAGPTNGIASGSPVQLGHTGGRDTEASKVIAKDHSPGTCYE